MAQALCDAIKAGRKGGGALFDMTENQAGRSGDIPFFSSAELGELTVEMVGAARQRLDIVSRSLEPAVYDTVAFLEAAKKLVLAPRGQARIVLLDPAELLSRGGHRLVDLAMRASSHMEIRRPGPDDLEFNEAMLIADQRGVIYRKLSDRYEGVANFDSPLRAAQLAESFEALWQNAEAVPHFRRLML